MTVRSRRVSYISLVEAEQPDRPRVDSRIIASEELSKERLTLAQRYVQATKVAGALVGAVCGHEAWDVRPLLLDDGQLKLIRFVSPNWILDREKSNAIRGIYSELATLPWGTCLAFGENQGQLWVCRKYYEHTLEETESLDPTVHPIQIVQRIITILDSFHEAGIVHGHLCPANLTLENNDAVLFDFGFSSLDRNIQAADRAPEIEQGARASVASDVYGLGIIIERFLKDTLKPEHLKLLERMKAREPALRPGLHEVKRMFALQPPSAENVASVQRLPTAPSATANTSLGRGRLINGRVYPTAQSAAHNGDKDSAAYLTKGAYSRPASTLPPEISRKLKRAEAEKSRQIPPELLQQVRAYSQSAAPAVAAHPPITETQSAGVNEVLNETSTPNRFSNRRVLMLSLVMLAGMLLTTFYIFQRSAGSVSVSSIPSQDLESYWSSAQPSLMLEVAQNALAGDEAARAVIVRTAFANKTLPKVRHRLLKFAFNPAWEGELSEQDRAIALGLALYDLMPAAITGLMPLEHAHPGVILGVVAEMQVASASNQFKSIPLQRMSQLPAPYGLAFQQLAKTGITDMGDSSAQALAHILVGDYNTDVLTHFFANATPIKILILLPLMRDKSRTDLEATIVSFLKGHQSFGSMVRWFDEEKTAEWEKVSWFDKLMISIGSLPNTNFALEQYADLLRYPDQAIVQESAKLLSTNPALQSLGAGLKYLASAENRLNRYQTIALVLALSFKGDVADSFVAAWFNTQPSPEAVLELLLERKDRAEADSFNFEATRYLVNRTWQGDISTMKRLAMHPEPLARALAYARLDLSRPEELKLLVEMSQIEPNARIRTKLLERIKGTQEELR